MRQPVQRPATPGRPLLTLCLAACALLADEEFNDDRVDAAEIGAGHTVTAL